MKRIFCVMVIGHAENEVLAYNVSQEAYESLDDAKAFIKGRSGETVAEDDNGWVAVKTVADQPALQFEYRIIELDVVKSREENNA